MSETVWGWLPLAIAVAPVVVAAVVAVVKVEVVVAVAVAVLAAVLTLKLASLSSTFATEEMRFCDPLKGSWVEGNNHAVVGFRVFVNAMSCAGTFQNLVKVSPENGIYRGDGRRCIVWFVMP